MNNAVRVIPGKYRDYYALCRSCNWLSPYAPLTVAEHAAAGHLCAGIAAPMPAHAVPLDDRVQYALHGARARTGEEWPTRRHKRRSAQLRHRNERRERSAHHAQT